MDYGPYIIAAIPATIAAVAAWRGERASTKAAKESAQAAKIAAAGVEQSKSNEVKIQQVQIAIDGRLTQLLELTAASSRAEGVKQEKDNPSIQ